LIQRVPWGQLSSQRPKSVHVAGSSTGGIAATQKMIDWCAQPNIVAKVEVTPMSQINEASERMSTCALSYRFVIALVLLTSAPQRPVPAALFWCLEGE
jgi:D-arabinose 1-dehydrogenase-like Zn-dependent alcohol dehydrogenase